MKSIFLLAFLTFSSVLANRYGTLSFKGPNRIGKAKVQGARTHNNFQSNIIGSRGSLQNGGGGGLNSPEDESWKSYSRVQGPWSESPQDPLSKPNSVPKPVSSPLSSLLGMPRMIPVPMPILIPVPMESLGAAGVEPVSNDDNGPDLSGTMEAYKKRRV